MEGARDEGRGGRLRRLKSKLKTHTPHTPLKPQPLERCDLKNKRASAPAMSPGKRSIDASRPKGGRRRSSSSPHFYLAHISVSTASQHRLQLKRVEMEHIMSWPTWLAACVCTRVSVCAHVGVFLCVFLVNDCAHRDLHRKFGDADSHKHTHTRLCACVSYFSQLPPLQVTRWSDI